MTLLVNMETAAGDKDSTAFKALNNSRFAELIVWPIPNMVWVAGQLRLN